MTTERFTELKVDSDALVYVLSELHETHARLRRQLTRLQGEVTEVLDTVHFDSPFLQGAIRDLQETLVEHRTLRQAAKLAGANPIEIAAVQAVNHVIVMRAD